MNYFSIDFLIVYAFLAVTLIVGIRAGRRVQDVGDYILANRSFGKWSILLSYLATAIAGGAVLGTAAQVYTEGAIKVFSLLSYGIMLTLTAFFVVPKIAYFKNCLTLGDITASFYGENSKIISGVLGFVTLICRAGMDLIILGIICQTLLGIKASWGIVVGGTILAIYSAQGGIRSVAATDVFQFLILLLVIPLIAYIVVNKAGGTAALFMQLPSEKLQIFSHKKFSYYLTYFLIWSFLPLGIASNPATMQRFLMARSGKELREQRLISAAFDPAFRITIMLIGLAGFILFPAIPAKNIVPHIIQTLLPTGLKGLAIAGLLAVVMSTVDSYFHAAGFTIVHDVIKPICDKRKIQINELRWMRWATILISGIAIFIGLFNSDIYRLVIVPFGFSGPLLMFPVLSCIMGLKPDKQAFYAALVTTIITFSLCEYLLPANQDHYTVLITIAANGITFFGLHLIKNRGFVIVNRTTLTETLWKPKRKTFLDILKAALPTPKRIIAYSQNKVALYGAPYILFGVFCVINYVLPYFIWMKPAAPYENLMIYIRLIGGTMAILLIVQEKWPQSFLRFFPTFWHLTVLYCLPFTNTIMFLLTNGSTEWLINILAIIIMLFVLLDWLTAIIVGISGVAMGFLFYHVFIGPLSVPLNFSAKYSIVYQGIFGLLIGLIFARRKEQRFDEIVTDRETLTLVNEENKAALLEIFKEKIRLLKTLKQAKVKDLTKAVGLVKELAVQQEQGFKEKEVVQSTIGQLKNTLTPMAIALERIESRATDYLRLEIKSIAIDNLLSLLQGKLLRRKFLIKNLSTYKEMNCDTERIQKLLLNSVEVLKASLEEEGAIYMTLEDTYLTYPLSTVKKDKSYVKKVPAIAFSLSTTASVPEAKPSYQAQMQRETLPIPTNPTSLLLVTNERIVKAHYGYTNIDISRPKDYDMHRYVLPVHVNDVRPRDMDDPYMELGVDLVRADDTYPGALEQERAFLSLVQQKTSASLSDIEMAIEMIKWYHGPVKRKSGEPFYLHPLAVAQIVLDYNTDEATILGALLHDIVEDTPMLLENIELMFGGEVAAIVDGVTHFESVQDSFYKVQLAPHENIMMLLDVEDKRVLYVKIADRMHNMRTIKGHSSYAKQRQIAEETLQFFVPLAQKLGLDEAAEELKVKSMAVIMDAK
ncbi:MAG: sodium:solute symporter family protein [Candidatus Amoebophilus sp.]